MYPTQLSYMPAAGMYTYPANYCMLPAMYGSSSMMTQTQMSGNATGLPQMTGATTLPTSNAVVTASGNTTNTGKMPK